ncbi:hypothetical protein GCM10010340_24300 [Streptomyces griseoloalbus]|nr:hypothetical protein GCM10010340_24300 [Streptomyces albaduncus]
MCSAYVGMAWAYPLLPERGSAGRDALTSPSVTLVESTARDRHARGGDVSDDTFPGTPQVQRTDVRRPGTNMPQRPATSMMSSGTAAFRCAECCLDVLGTASNRLIR